MKPKGTISQLKVTGSISQLEVRGSLSQLSINGELVQSGYTFVFTEAEVPTLLVATASASDQIDLTWQDNSEREGGFSIERSTDGVEYEELDTVLADVESYSDTTCEELTEYFYRVRAYRGLIYSGYSNADSDTTPSGAVYDADLLTYIDGLITPLSEGQLALLNTFITALKTGLSITNLSDAFDVMYILAGETAESSLRNLVKRAHDAEAVNSPTFTALEGWQSDVISSYIDSNYNSATEASKFTLNENSIGVYSRTDSAHNGASIGARATGTGDTYMTIRHSLSRFYARNNVLTDKYVDSADSRGMFITNRLDSNNFQQYINKSKTDQVQATTAIPNNKIFILCWSATTGAPQLYSNKQHSFAFMGAKLTQANVETIVDAFEAYMDANSKGVLP